jgi:hypothetical protein
MLQKKAETEEESQGTVMMESRETESITRRGKAVEIERGTGEEIETGIMDENGTEVDTDIKNSSRSAF